MTMLQKLILGVTMCFLAGVVRAEVIAPDALIERTVQEVITVIKHDEDIRAGDQKKILALVDAKVLPHFDFERMTQLAVGRPWRTASPEQKQALVREFRNMLVRTYTKVFSVYRDQAVDVKPVKLAADAIEATVLTTIIKPGAQPVPVNYEMRKVDSGWKAYDVFIEGVSMVMSYRGTFTTQIEQTGIDGLIKTLADKNANIALNKEQTK